MCLQLPQNRKIRRSWKRLLRQAVKEACMQMYQMRHAEGECMKNDLLAKLILFSTVVMRLPDFPIRLQKSCPAECI